MHDNTPGIFITLEGIEGTGKTTCSHYIAYYLNENIIPFILTREPGGTALAEKIRNIFLNDLAEKMQPETELLLIFAARTQHVHHLIYPALRQGKWVISDRFIDATYAYQGAGREISPAIIQTLDQWILKDTQPHFTFLLYAPIEIALERAKLRGSVDRIEQEDYIFFEKVQNAYLYRAQQQPERFCLIDTSQALDQVKAEICLTMERLKKQYWIANA